MAPRFERAMLIGLTALAVAGMTACGTLRHVLDSGIPAFLQDWLFWVVAVACVVTVLVLAVLFSRYFWQSDRPPATDLRDYRTQLPRQRQQGAYYFQKPTIPNEPLKQPSSRLPAQEENARSAYESPAPPVISLPNLPEQARPAAERQASLPVGQLIFREESDTRPPRIPAPYPTISSLDEALQALKSKVDEIATDFARVERVSREKLGTTQEIAALVRVMTPPRPVSDSGGTVPIEELLLSAAAYCLAGSCPKTELPALLGEVKVPCALMLHKDIAAFLADPGAYRLEFVPSMPDAGWLWYEQDPGKVLGIPIDAGIFRIPPAPALLARLFEGGADLATVRIVRPCCFRKDDGTGYTLVSNGRMEKAGSAGIGTAAGYPRNFSVLRAMLRPITIAPETSSFATILRAQLELIRDRIQSIESRSRDLNAVSECLRKAEDTQAALLARIKALEETASQKEQKSLSAASPDGLANPVFALQVRSLAKRTEALETSVRQLTQFASGTERPDAASPVGLADRSLGIPPSQKGVASRAAVGSAETQTFPQSGEVPIGTRVSPETMPPMTPAPLRPSFGPGVPLVEPRLPDGWQQVVADAVSKAELEPAAHIAALAELLDGLRKLRGATTINLVHAVESGRRIKIHFAKVEGGQIQCPPCGPSKPFAFAVCVGDEDAERLYLLFPAGRYATSNYPMGYACLLSGSPSDKFTIQSVEAPAILQRVPGEETPVYSVTQPMLITLRR